MSGSINRHSIREGDSGHDLPPLAQVSRADILRRMDEDRERVRIVPLI